jgi:hypothetical protein
LYSKVTGRRPVTLVVRCEATKRWHDAFHYRNMERMQMMKAFIAAIGVLTVNVALPTGSDNAIQGMIAKLNQPGAIAVQITVGAADGVQEGDVFVVKRQNKEIGKLLIIDVDEDTSTANITAADKNLTTGDLVAHK